jgi:hypothetical protein
MSFEKNKALARRYQEEVWGKGNLALIDELVAADFLDHSLPAGMDPGFAGTKTAVQGALDAFPDGQWTVEDLIAEGDQSLCPRRQGQTGHWWILGTITSTRGTGPGKQGRWPFFAGIVVLALPLVGLGCQFPSHILPVKRRMLVRERGIQRPLLLVSQQDEPYLLRGCSVKKRTISVEASGPCGSV